jgi:hypothetical protein
MPRNAAQWRQALSIKTLGRWEVIVGIEMEFSELDIGRIADLPVRGVRAITIIRGCITAKVTIQPSRGG